MKANEVVNLLQLYRHDLLNHLQVIHGYVKLGKLDKVEANMSKLFEHMDKERNLFKLNMPHIILWILEFEKKYQNYQLSYTVDSNYLKLADADMYIKEKLEQIMQDMEQRCDNESIYKVHIQFKEDGDIFLVNVSVDLEDTKQMQGVNGFEEVNIIQSENDRNYSFKVFTS